MKASKRYYKLVIPTTLFFICAQTLFAQAWNITGNANVSGATNYLGTSNLNDLVFRTNAIERGRVLAAGGTWRFGSATNNMQVDSTGRLRFNGNGVYQVANNRYAFQLATSPNSGLFFNTTLGQYEFRSPAAIPVLSINATTGAGNFTGALKVGAYTLPATDGAANQVLKTNGAGTLTWSADNNSGSSSWSRTGNAGTSAATNFIGTTDAVDFVARTANTERLRITSTGITNFLYPVGINGSYNNSYALNINASSSYSGINITDPVDNYSLFTSKSGFGNSIVAYKTSGSDFYPVIYADNAGYGPGTQSYSNNGSGIIGSSSYSYGGYLSSSNGYGSYSYSANNNALYAYNFNNSAYWAGFFVGDVYSTTGIFTGSDQNLKQNIKDMSGAMNIISQLKPKQYDFRHDGDFSRMNLPQGNHYGLIAQDVEKILPNLVKTSKFDLPPTMKDGKPDPQEKKAEGKDYKSLNYTELIPVLVKGMQEQQQTITDQQKQIDELKAMVLSLTQNSIVEASNSAVINTVKITSAILDQNVPNPLNGSTSIRYTIPVGAKNASLLISDINGKSIKQTTLNKEGAGVINVEASTLSAGTYSYTLLIDGKIIDTKKMIIAR